MKSIIFNINFLLIRIQIAKSFTGISNLQIEKYFYLEYNINLIFFFFIYYQIENSIFIFILEEQTMILFSTQKYF